jgi:transposase
MPPTTRGDFYLTRLPLTGETKAQFDTWVEDAITGAKRGEVVDIHIGADRVGMGYEFTRDQTAPLEGRERSWVERVQVIRSESTAETQARAFQRRLEKACAAVRALTPPPGPGRPQFTTGWELERAVAALLAEHEVTGLLDVTWTREETSRTRYVGRGRGGPDRPKKTEWTIRYQITTIRRDEAAIQGRVARMGWWIQVTNVPARRLSLEGSVAAYRGGWSLERDFHLLKDRPLGIGPLWVRRDDQIVGLTHLLSLALRMLTLFELLVRQGQERAGERLPGLYPGQAGRTTEHPTGSRVLSAIARAEVTLTRVEMGDDVRWYLTDLPLLLRRVLAYLGLPETLYTGLVINSS